MHWTVYIKANGEILRSVTCEAGDIAAQLAEHEAATPGTAHWRTHVVQGGRIVPRPQPLVEPHEFAVWDRFAQRWTERLTTEKAWAAVRERRDALLAETDWRVLRATEQGHPVPPEWLTYRQALRDVTQQTSPFSITWPAPPAE